MFELSYLLAKAKCMNQTDFQARYWSASFIKDIRIIVQECFREYRIITPVGEHKSAGSGTKKQMAINHVSVRCLKTHKDTHLIGN